MRIAIDVKAYYDWMPLPADAGTPTEDDVRALRVKPQHNGGWLMKVRLDRATTTDISIPESQLKDLSDHYDRQGAPKRRAAIAAWMIEEKVMPHHAHVNDFSKIHVDGEPEVEKFLNDYFQLSGGA